MKSTSVSDDFILFVILAIGRFIFYFDYENKEQFLFVGPDNMHLCIFEDMEDTAEMDLLALSVPFLPAAFTPGGIIATSGRRNLPHMKLGFWW